MVLFNGFFIMVLFFTMETEGAVINDVSFLICGGGKSVNIACVY